MMQAKLLYTVVEDAFVSRFHTPEQRARNLCTRIEQLGPACIKLGQLASTVPGLIQDKTLQQQLSSRLHDRVKARPVTELLGPADMHELPNLVVHPEPLGSASIAQVHRAHWDGQEVAVKVVRPDASDSIQQSFAAIESSLSFCHSWLPSAGDVSALHNTRLLLNDACTMLQAELDMDNELSNMQSFAKCPDIIVPQPIGTHLHGRVLVMELIEAASLGTACSRLPPSQRSELAHQIAGWWLDGVLRHKVAHGDPHIPVV